VDFAPPFNQQNLALAWRSIEPALDRELPGWKEINRDPWWISWLHGLDALTQLPRQRLLDDVVARKDVEGVVALFRNFVPQHRQAPAHEQAQSRTATTRGRPVIYSRSDIISAHQAYMKGAYRGREVEYEALQAEFQRASAEGRIAGALPLSKTR
jgi:hypothetical protein